MQGSRQHHGDDMWLALRTRLVGLLRAYGHENLERTYEASIRFDRIFPHGAFVLNESPRRRPISPQFGLDIRQFEQDCT